MEVKKISPCEVAVILKRRGVPHGQDYILPYDIDTSGCKEFGGTRCDCNIHVRGRNIAHWDRVDPRRDLVGHWEKDCDISVGPLFLFGAIGIGLLAWLVTGVSRNQNAASRLIQDQPVLFTGVMAP